MKPISQIIGIDFVTSNSSVAIMKDGVPTMIPNQKGNYAAPSVIAFSKDGWCLIGDDALGWSKHHLESVANVIEDFLAKHRIWGSKGRKIVSEE